jgi:CRISPR-associated protein Cas2
MTWNTNTESGYGFVTLGKNATFPSTLTASDLSTFLPPDEPQQSP